jgi:hypothetical protein
MNVSYIIGAIILLIILIVAYFVIIGKPVPVANVSAMGPFPLNTKTSVLTTSSFMTPAGSLSFLKEGTGTFQAYVYLDSLSQTGGQSSCGTLPNQPSCSSGLYDPCACNAMVDCTNCSHDGYKNIISLYGVYTLEVLPYPDASRQNTVSAQLAVQTQTATDSFIETVPLPPIPLQKWVMITLSKSGRRVDVYYNDQLVASSTLLNMISTLQPSGAIAQAGDTTLSGKIGGIVMSGSTATIGSVASAYSSTSDTRGAPKAFPSPTAIKASGPGLLSSLCLDGSCLQLPRIGDASPSISQLSDSLNGLNSSESVSVVSPAFNVVAPYQ